jgi:starch synthase
MNFWLPYTKGNSGSDVSIKQLAMALEQLGHTALPQEFKHNYQYTPWFLKFTKMPSHIDCVIGNSWNAFAFKRKNIPLITVERLFVLDNEYLPYKSFAQRVFHSFILSHWLKRSYKSSEAIVALSHSTARGISSVFSWAKPTVIMNAVDIQFFKPAQSEPQKSLTGPLKILYVGNLSKRKGTDLIPAVLDGLNEQVELHYTEDRNQTAGIQHPWAKCIGRLSLEEIKIAYQNADLLILPTRLEGLPRAAMESIACGTPVISSDASSLPEIVKDGVTGFTCEKDNVASFVAKINEIIANRSLLNQLSKSSTEYALQELDLTKMAEKYVALAIELQSEINGK